MPSLIEKLSQIINDANKINDFSNDIPSDDVESLDSGNQSENDEVNKIEKKK